MPKRLEAIIFDLGGVILNLDYRLTDEALKSLLDLRFEGRDYPKNYIHLFNNYEKGSLSEASFFSLLVGERSPNLNVIQLRRAWNAMLLDLPVERLDLLLNLRENFKVFLLSNTNETHLKAFYQGLYEEHKISDFDAVYFDQTFYSHLLGMRKPDAEIYEYLLNSQKLDPRKTLFVDDTPGNLDAPAKMGVNVVLHPRNADLANSMNHYLASVN